MKKLSPVLLLLWAVAPGAALSEGDIDLPVHSFEQDIDLEHSIPDGIDPLVRSEIVSLRSRGVLDIQSQVGTDLIALERLQRRAQAVRDLIGVLGVEGLRLYDPELYDMMQNSPVLITQKITDIELARELKAIEEANMEPEPAEEEEPEYARRSPDEVFGIGGIMPNLRIDLEEQEQAETEEAEPEPPAIVDFPISLREIYGGNGVFRAVILHGTETIRIEVGDILPNETEILNIEPDSILIRRRDREFEIFLRG